MLLGGIAADGSLRLHSVEQPVEPESGWRVLAFAPPRRAGVPGVPSFQATPASG